MPVTLSGATLRRGTTTATSPTSLFAASEVGVWYDPSDLSTMFQDSAGSTPVTGVEQPVALILDKSKNLTLGSELVINGTFDTNTSSWLPMNSPTLSVDTGRMKIVGGGGSSGAYQDITLSSSKSYLITASMTVDAASTQTCFISLRQGGAGGFSNITGYTDVSASAGGSRNAQWILTGQSMVRIFCVAGYGGAGGIAYYDNISLKELPGNHAYQSVNTTYRPLLSARYNLLTKTEQFDDAAWSAVAINAFGSGSIANTTATTDPIGGNTAEYLQENTSSSGHGVSQTITISTGIVYLFSAYFKAAQRTFAFLRVAGTPNLTAFFNLTDGTIGTTPVGLTSSIVNVGNGWYRCSISWTSTVTGSQTWTAGMASADNTLSYTGNGTSGIYVWGADLRVANDGVGIPRYQRVNTSTDYDTNGFPYYLLFDGSNDYLVTNSIDFSGTDKVTAWTGIRKLQDTTQAIIAELSVSLGSTSGTFNIQAPSVSGVYYRFASRGTVSASYADLTSATYASPQTAILTGIGSISEDIQTLRFNGSQAATNSVDQGFGNYTLNPLYIGSRAGTSNFFNGRLYGLIVRGAASTTRQITDIEAYIESKTMAY